jgi:type II secretory pathway pseudopilin PulG
VTLFEMLTVMAILSILLLMLLPGQDALIKETKVHAAVQDIEMLKKAVLRFHADLGVWPADDQLDPQDGLSDIDLMGGQCGGQGSSEPGSDQGDPGILCQGNPSLSGARVALSPTESNANFTTAAYTTGMARRWRGPYINRETKSNPFGGSYKLDLDTNLPNVPGQTFFSMVTTAKDVLLVLTNVPKEYQLRIDADMDDGNLSTGFVQSPSASTLLQVIVAVY